jgi:DnaJ family protein C protein 13
MQHIAQLRWTLLLTPSTATNEDDVPVAQPNAHGLWTLSELCAHILDMFIQMCTAFPSRDADNCCVRPIPRVKRFLSVPVNLPHIVQLLLTFDAAIVERTAVLLALVMQVRKCLCSRTVSVRTG